MQADLATLREFFALSPFMRELGVEVLDVSAGRIRTALVPGKRHQQHTGYVHAGVMASLADHSMGSAAQTLAPQAHWALTAELKTSQLRPGRGERLVCDAWVLKPGRTLSFTEAEVWAEQGSERVLVMKASGTMALVPQDRQSLLAR
jgi:uncharacterized protein (TIGR00369 family)